MLNANMPSASKLMRYVDPFPFVPRDPKTLDARCWEIAQTQAHGLARRLRYVAEATGNPNHPVSIGVSGGLDSTSALLGTIDAFKLNGRDWRQIRARSMPGYGTSQHTRDIASRLCTYFGVDFAVIDIKDAVTKHLQDIGAWCVKQSKDGLPCRNCLACANAQARERTNVLMDLGFVIGTGDMSELALGWCTYNADQMAMYNIQPGMPKTLIKHFIAWRARQAEKKEPELARILWDAVGLDYDPELSAIPQKTEDAIGPYELHDFTLCYLIRNGFAPRKILFLQEIASRVQKEKGGYSKPYTLQELAHWMCVFYERFGPAQFKRNAGADGPQYGSVALSKTGAFRGPTDMDLRVWIQDLKGIAGIAE